MPYAILMVVLGMVVWLSTFIPAPSVLVSPVAKPEPELAHQLLVNAKAAQKMREGDWCVTEQWQGGECTFSTYEESERRSPSLYEHRFAHITSDTIEITRINWAVELQGKDQLRTDSVQVVKYDTRQVGSLDATPIEWNDTKEKAHALIQDGQGCRGLYSVDKDQLVIYFSNPLSRTVPTRIPDRFQLELGGQLFFLNRHRVELSQVRNRFAPPGKHFGLSSSILVDADSEIAMVRSYLHGDWDVEFCSEKVEPLQDPFPGLPKRAARYVNGWIIQYDVRESSEVMNLARVKRHTLLVEQESIRLQKQKAEASDGASSSPDDRTDSFE